MKPLATFLALYLPCLGALSCSDPGPGKDLDPFEEPDLSSPPDLAPAPDLATTVLATATGFDVPESAYFHEASSSWYVSNLSLTDLSRLAVKDNKGWISKLDRDGKVVQQRWVEASLSSPAGIRATGGQLVVANIDELVFINIANQAVTRVAVPGARLLNDVDVAADGTVYATDTFGNAIWSYKSGSAPQKVLEGAELNYPNGILVAGGRLLIATTGPFDKPDPGGLLGFNLNSMVLTPLGLQGKLDGMEPDGAALFVSENPTARVYAFDVGQAPRLVRDLKAQDGLQTAGDIGFDAARRLLAVPDLQGNTVTFVRVP